MPIEVATYISDLVVTNPVGATDNVSTSDDHLRLLKSTIKATLPNLTGAMTRTHTQLNNAPDKTSDSESVSGDWTFTGDVSFDGTIGGDATVSTDGLSAAEIGTAGAVQNVQDGNYTLVLSDRGKSIDKQAGGAGETITIPANSSVAFPIGTIIMGDNDGGGTLTIAITTDTLEDTSGNTGSRTVADNGQWVIKKIATTKWRISGSGIS